MASVLKCSIISYDYSGYGKSSGVPTEEAIYSDIKNIANFANSILAIANEDIILMGYSLGAVPTIHIASEKSYRNISGIMLIAPAVSDYSFHQSEEGNENHKKQKKEKKNPLPLLRKATEIYCPVFIIHGEKDVIIPIEQSKQLGKRLNGVVYKWFPQNGDHTNLVSFLRRKFYRKSREFIEYLRRIYSKDAIMIHNIKSGMNISESSLTSKMVLTSKYQTDENTTYELNEDEKEKKANERNASSLFLNGTESMNSLSLESKSN